jgi:hypothetical protein
VYFYKVKKIVAICLLVIYGVSSIGATVHLHYCMGKFVNWSFTESKDDKCGNCGMKGKSKKDCCKDEHKEFKLKTDHQKSAITDVIHFISTPVLLTPISNYIFQLPVTATYGYSNYHPPPAIHNQNLQVLYCTFLI